MGFGINPPSLEKETIFYTIFLENCFRLLTIRNFGQYLYCTIQLGDNRNMIDPTRITYTGLTEAYDLFNERLFVGKLPRCLITMQRKRGAYGYFSSKRFGTRDGSEITDEIALNPKHFRKRTDQETLSTLVHEMCHLQQAHFGKPGVIAHPGRQQV